MMAKDVMTNVLTGVALVGVVKVYGIYKEKKGYRKGYEDGVIDITDYVIEEIGNDEQKEKVKEILKRKSK